MLKKWQPLQLQPRGFVKVVRANNARTGKEYVYLKINDYLEMRERKQKKILQNYGSTFFFAQVV